MRILGNVFSQFARMVQFPGNLRTAPNEFDIDAPIQPVWDFSRQGETGGIRLGGICNSSIVNTHDGGAASTVFGTQPVETINMWTRAGGSPESHWLWLREATLQIDVAATGFIFAGLSVAQVDDKGPIQAHVRTLAIWTNFTAELIDGTGGAVLGGIGGKNNDMSTTAVSAPMIVPSPAFIPRNSTLHFFSRAVGTAPDFVRVDLQWQITPIGVGPFGMR